MHLDMYQDLDEIVVGIVVMKPVQLKIGFGCLEPGFLAITRALYQTATLPLRASNEVLVSSLVY